MDTAIRVDDLKQDHRAVWQLVDVRSPAEFASGHVPGAVNIPLESLESRLGDLGPNTRTLLICQSGQRARLGARWLGEHGIDCAVLEGGTAAWEAAGRPVVCSARHRWSLERQVRLGAGAMVTIGVLLGAAVDPLWFGLSAFVGLGLMAAGVTDFCPMALLLARMPWNGTRRSACMTKSGCGV